MFVQTIYNTSIDSIPGRLATQLLNISDGAVMRQKLLDETTRIRLNLAKEFNALADKLRPSEISDSAPTESDMAMGE